MYTVDLIGSCASRDIFNRNFIPNYNEFFRLKTYLPRVAIPNIISDSCHYDYEMLKSESNSPWQFECFYKLCERHSLDALVIDAPDILIFDFYTDARWGIAVYTDGNCITNNAIAMELNSLKDTVEKYYNYSENTEEYFVLWKKSIDFLVAFCRKMLPNTKLLINGIKGTNLIQDGNEISKNVSDDELESVNALWKRMDEYVSGALGVDILSYEKKYLLDPGYIYGGVGTEIVHFDQSYYEDFFEKLLQYARENVQERMSSVVEMPNLIKNNDFSNGFLYWEKRNADFDITKEDGRNWISLNAKNNRKYFLKKLLQRIKKNEKRRLPKWYWIWSNPVEINSDTTEEFTLSFDFKVRDSRTKVSALIGIRLFNSMICEECRDATQVLMAEPDKGMSIEANRVYHIDYTFCPRGKFIRIAPHFPAENNAIAFSNICLKKGRNTTYIPWINRAVKVE